MPQYANNGLGNLAINGVLPAVLWPGDEIYPFGTTPLVPGQSQKPNDSNVQFEAVNLNERSIAAALAPRPGGGAAPGVMVQVFASANPGAAEIDVQDAAVDADGVYQTPTGNAAYKLTTWTAMGNGQYTSFAELVPETGPFVSLKVIANPNAVNFWAKLKYV